MSTLLDSLTSLATPAVSQIAHRFGESDAAVSRGIQASFGSVLGGLAAKTKDPGAMRRVFDLVTDPATATNGPDVQSMLGGLTGGSPMSGIAGSLLTTLFGGRTNAVGDLIARTAGFKNPSTGPSLLTMAAPLVLSLLGKKVRDNGANVASLTNLLAGQRDSFLAAAPAGLLNFVETGGAVPADGGETLRGTTTVGTQTATTGGGKWMWPVLAVAALALIWFVSRGRAPDTGAALDSAASRTGAAVKAAAGDVADAVGKLGAFGRRMLPGGVELNIPEFGIESKLITFIEDGARPVDATTWFEFDRLNFATGSATILPESQEQLDNISAVLKAYPNVNVKVGGYTDNVGDDAANMRLSQQRADAVMQALIATGIAATRLEAEGYGEQHPIGDNATEEGRAMNRRIALRVTKK